MMELDIKTIISEFVDYLMPELAPFEASVYLYLFRHSYLSNGNPEVRVGKKKITANFGVGSRGVKTNYDKISNTLKGLEKKGCIQVGDTTREGTLYHVNLPSEVKIVIEKLGAVTPTVEDDCYSDLAKRELIFERDKLICQYCGDRVTPDTATLDHFIPQSKGGTHGWENLRTSCLMCNSIKSGKTYEEAAPLLLRSIQERRARHQ